MAEKVEISRRSAKRVGKAAANGIKGEISDLQSTLKQTNRKLDQLEQRIDQLEESFAKIERTKAAAQREAMEDLVDDLRAQVDEKRAEFERRRSDVLEDYRDSIRRLKDRFVGAISGNREQFEQVESEFAAAEETRSRTVEANERLSDGPVRAYDRRLDAVIESRNQFLSAINDFLDDRETTAETIDSLQTPLPGVSGQRTVDVPFWVVGIEKDGREELRVLPVLQRGSGDATASRAQPYVNYLREHPTHSYGDMTAAVREYVVRDDVRDQLARQDGEFADPGFLRGRDETLDRFVDALEEYQMGVTSTAGSTGTSEPAAEPSDRREVPGDA
jgi:predicted  nucleic acid-binding Zn-ribbon protein